MMLLLLQPMRRVWTPFEGIARLITLAAAMLVEALELYGEAMAEIEYELSLRGITRSVDD